MSSVNEDHFIGFYPKEFSKDYGSYRWTRPIAGFYFILSKGNYLVNIETGNIRGNPSNYILELFFNEKRINDADINKISGRFFFLIKSEDFVSEDLQSITSCVIPLANLNKKHIDDRVFGMPIVEVNFEKNAS
tara:strand:- start:133 stop:531 length:399 start_codon:yes stop_codon:yes gene_type:complete